MTLLDNPVKAILTRVLGVYQATTVKTSGLKVRVVEDDDLKDMVSSIKKSTIFETLIAESSSMMMPWQQLKR